MSLTSENINHTFYKALNLKNDVQAYQGKWVNISLQAWVNYVSNELSNIANESTINLDKYFVDFLVNKIFDADYKAGCFYEVYERRRQDEIEEILSTLNLNDNEVALFKSNVEYIDKTSSNPSICEDCGIEFPSESGHIIQSLAIEGKELCQRCFTLCFIE